MRDTIEFQNETEESFNVLVCQSALTGRIFVHLLGNKEEFHGDDATEVMSEDYEIVNINNVEL